MLNEVLPLRRDGRGTRKTAAGRNILLAALLGMGCTGAAFAAASVTPGDDQVVASRGGSSVTLLEIDARIMELPAKLRADYLNDPTRIEDTINGLLLEKQMAARAGELGLTREKDPYLEAQIEQSVSRYLGARAKQLEEEQIALPDFTALAQEKYQANPGKYASPTTLELTHILVTDRGRTAADAMARAEEARKLALGGKDFSELVAEYTDEQSAGKTSTGKLTDVVTGVMVPEFEKVAFALKSPGDISDVVKTRFGYHVIRLDARKESVQQPLEAVQPQIVEELRKQFVDQTKGTTVDELRSKKIEADAELVASLRMRYVDGGPVMSKVSAADARSADASH